MTAWLNSSGEAGLLGKVCQVILSDACLPGLCDKAVKCSFEEEHKTGISLRGLDRPVSNWIQLATPSGGCVALMCFRASSSSTSPVGASDRTNT